VSDPSPDKGVPDLDWRTPVPELPDPVSYATVGEWFADYHGYVPIQMARGLTEYMARHGCTFREAYASLRKAGAIIEVDRPRPVTPELSLPYANLDSDTQE
jgi:hypothetical protein